MTLEIVPLKFGPGGYKKATIVSSNHPNLAHIKIVLIHILLLVHKVERFAVGGQGFAVKTVRPVDSGIDSQANLFLRGPARYPDFGHTRALGSEA